MKSESEANKSGGKRTGLIQTSFEDPLKKREQFAVTLRKKKKQEII